MSDPMTEAPTPSSVEASENVPAQDISEPQAHSSIVTQGQEPSEGREALEQATRAVLIRLWEKRGEAAPVVPPPNPTTTYVPPEPAWVEGDEVPAEVREREQAALVAKLRGRDPEFGTSLEALRAHRRGEQLPRGWVAAPSGVETAEHAKARQLRERREMGHPDPPQPPFEWTKSHGINDVGFAEEQALKAATLAKPPMTKTRRGRLTTAAQRRERPEPEWSVEKVIPEWGVGQIFGRSYSGKTYVALDLALRYANGVEAWHGHQLKRPGPVVYVLMEGAFDFQARIDAWLSAHPGCTDDALYTLEEEAVDLANPDSLGALMLDIELAGIDPALVVIDTQALATPGADENSNSEMNLVFAKLKMLSKRLGCPVATVHHTGHEQAQRSRGASSVFAALDFQLRVADGEISVPKVKAGRPIEGLAFRITSGANGSAYAEPIAQDQDNAAGRRLAAGSAEVEGREQRIVGYITARGQATAAQVAELLDLGESTVRGILRGLVQDGRLERVEGGHTQGGREPHRFRIPEAGDS